MKRKISFVLSLSALLGVATIFAMAAKSCAKEAGFRSTQEQEYRKRLGTKVVIDEDTLTIVRYRDGYSIYVLSNDLEVDVKAIEKLASIDSLKVANK